MMGYIRLLSLVLVLSLSLVDNVLCYPDPDVTVNCSSTGYPAVPCSAPANAVTLDLSHNHMEKIPEGCFPSLLKLKRLLLQFNSISTVDPNAFQHNPVLEYLDISHNLLPKISALPFTSLPALTYLDIFNNAYEDIVLEQSFDPHSRLQSLKLGSSQSVSIRKDHVKRLGELHLKEVHLVVGENNKYEPGSLSVLKNLDMLTIDTQYMQDLGQFLVLMLDIRNSTTSLTIKKVDIRNESLFPVPYPQLELSISRLIVQDVKVNGSFCNNLPYFQKSLPEEVALENIHGENICTFMIGPFDRCHLRKLSVKNMDNKSFLRFGDPQGTFGKFMQCFLELSAINIGETFFPCPMAVSLRNLKKLNLSMNELNDWRLFTMCDKPFPALQSMAIDHNIFQHLGGLGNATAHMKDLVNFTASYNSIHLEPQTVFINWTKSLRRLNLRGNQITDEALQFLPKTLEMLDVSYNNIDTVPHLQAMRDLQELFLSGNKIIMLHSELLPSSVRLLHVDRNNMSTISVATIRSLNLTELDFSGNPLHCDCDTLELAQFCRDSSTEILNWPSRYQCQSPDSLQNETLEHLSLSWPSCHTGTFALIMVCCICVPIISFLLYKRLHGHVTSFYRRSSYGSVS